MLSSGEAVSTHAHGTATGLDTSELFLTGSVERTGDTVTGSYRIKVKK